jgi:hypothetical protein
MSDMAMLELTVPLSPLPDLSSDDMRDATIGIERVGPQ